MEKPDRSKKKLPTKDKVLKAIEERGFSLELETYLELRKRGWITGMQSYFINVQPEKQDRSFLEALRDTWNAPPEPTYRTIDISAIKGVASKNPLIANATLGLTIECKFRKKEHWVFYNEPVAENQSLQLLQAGIQAAGVKDFETSFSSLSFGELSSFGDPLKKNARKKLNHKIVSAIRKTSHHCVSNMESFVLSHSTIFTSTNADNISNACRQVLGASMFFDKSNPERIAEMFKQSKPINYWRLYPVVVFSGPMWNVSFDSEQEKLLEPLGWTTYPFPFKGSLMSVDIVSFSSLNEYLKMLENEFRMLIKCLNNDDGLPEK